jgi:hypothetical protein
MHMWHHVTNHLIISNDKDSNSENQIKLRVRDTAEYELCEVITIGWGYQTHKYSLIIMWSTTIIT